MHQEQTLLKNKQQELEKKIQKLETNQSDLRTKLLEKTKTKENLTGEVAHLNAENKKIEQLIKKIQSKKEELEK
ncbi:Putative uncharacterized protein [Mycoplasma leachii 99/014/6]|nr:Putative uncharacterized protein [Mycoplasma leachii 99/014/6]